MSPTVKLPCWLTARTCTTSSLLGRCLNGPNWGRRKTLQSFQSWSDRVFIDSLNVFLMLVHALSSTIHSKHMQLIEFVRQIHPQHKNFKAFQIIKTPYPSPRLGDPGCGQSSHLEIWIITHLFGSCRVDHKFRALHSDGSLQPPKKNTAKKPTSNGHQKKMSRKITSCLQRLILTKKNLAKVSLKNQQILNPAKLSEQAFWPPSGRIVSHWTHGTSAMLVVSTILRTPAGAGSKISCCCCGVTWAYP